MGKGQNQNSEKIFDQQETTRRSSLHISIINKIVSKIVQKSNTTVSLNLIYIISTYVFPNPLVLLQNVNAYVQSQSKQLFQDRILYHSEVPHSKILNGDISNDRYRQEQQLSWKNTWFDKQIKQISQIRQQLKLKENYIFKIKVVRIWKNCQCALTQDSIMNLGAHLIQFFRSLRFGKKRRIRQFDSSQSDNNPIENQDQLFWGTKEGPVKIMAKNQKMIMHYLRQLKIYEKDKIIRQSLKKALIELLKSDILILFRVDQSQYNIFFQKQQQVERQMINNYHYSNRQLERNCNLFQQNKNKLSKDLIKSIIQRQRKQFVQFNGEQWMVKKQFQVWQKINSRGFTSRSKKRVKDGYLNQYFLDDYFLQQI